jgi:hypothetical protein
VDNIEAWWIAGGRVNEQKKTRSSWFVFVDIET